MEPVVKYIHLNCTGLDCISLENLFNSHRFLKTKTLYLRRKLI